MAELAWADALADEAKGVPRGRLRINAPLSFGTAVLSPIAASYLEVHREVEIDMVLNDRFVDPIEEEFEAVFRIGPLAQTALKAIELLPFKSIPCASPQYLQRRGVPIKPDDLSNHECMSYSYSATRVVAEWKLTRGDDTVRVPIHSRLKINNAAALMSAALAGYGIALVAEDLAQQFLSVGRLVRILPDYEIRPRPVHILVQPDRRPTPKLTSFLQFVTARIGYPSK